MSLFIGMLAFTDAERAAEIRIGVLLGSLAVGARRLPRPPRRDPPGAGCQLTHRS